MTVVKMEEKFCLGVAFWVEMEVRVELAGWEPDMQRTLDACNWRRWNWGDIFRVDISVALIMKATCTDIIEESSSVVIIEESNSCHNYRGYLWHGYYGGGNHRRNYRVVCRHRYSSIFCLTVVNEDKKSLVLEEDSYDKILEEADANIL